MAKKKVMSCVLLGFSIVLIYYVYKDVKFKDFMRQAFEIEWRYVAFSAVCMLLSAWYRNLRWLMLLSPLSYKIKRNDAFTALLLSYPANLIIPQSSFFVRASYLKKKSGVPFINCLGTIITEKIMDGLVVFVFFFLFMFANLKADFSFSSNYNTYLIVVPVFIAILFLGGMFIQSVLPNFWLKLQVIFSRQFYNLKQGLSTAQNIEHKSLLVFYTLMIWLPYCAIFYFLLKASMLSGFVVFQLPMELAVMANIGWIFPTQGGVGSYHFFVAKIMELRGFETDQAAFFAFFSHLMIISGDVLFGAAVLLRNFSTVKDSLVLKESF